MHSSNPITPREFFDFRLGVLGPCSARTRKEECWRAPHNGFAQAGRFDEVSAGSVRLANQTEADAKAIYEDEGGLYQTGIAKLKPMLSGPPDAWMGPLTRVDI